MKLRFLQSILFCATLAVGDAVNCVEATDQLRSMINPASVIEVRDQGNSTVKLVLEVEQIPGQVMPKNFAVIFSPNNEGDFLIPNAKSFSVLGDAVGATGSLQNEVSAPEGYTYSTTFPHKFYLSDPIQIPTGRVYYIASTGFVCDFSKESFGATGTDLPLRTKWVFAKRSGFPVLAGASKSISDPAISFDAVAVRFDKSSAEVDGEIVKFVIPMPSDGSIKAIKISHQNAGGLETSYDIVKSGEALTSSKYYSTATSSAIASKGMSLGSFCGYLQTRGGGFLTGIFWVPGKISGRVKLQVDNQDIAGVPVSIERELLPRRNIPLNWVLASIRETRGSAITNLDLLRIASSILIEGNLVKQGKVLFRALAQKFQDDPSRSYTADDIIELAGALAPYQAGKDLVIANGLVADAFLDGYTKVRYALGSQNSVSSIFFSNLYYQVVVSQDVSIHLKKQVSTKYEFAEIPTSDCLDDEGMLCSSPISGANLQEVLQGDGLWLRNERVFDRLDILAVDGRKDRGAEISVAKGNYVLSFRELEDIGNKNGVGGSTSPAIVYQQDNSSSFALTPTVLGSSSFIGYIDPRPVVSRPELYLNVTTLGGWNWNKNLLGYRYFDHLELPTKNPTRLRYAQSDAMAKATISVQALNAPQAYQVDDGSSIASWTLSVNENPQDPQGGAIKPEQRINNFEVTPVVKGDDNGDDFLTPIPQEVLLTFKAAETSSEVDVPITFYPNRKVNLLFYGGSDGAEIQRNRNFANTVAGFLRSRYKIYIEVLDAAALKLDSKYPSMPTDLRLGKFLAEARALNNGIPSLANFNLVNQGVPQTPGLVGYVYSFKDEAGTVQHGWEFFADDENKPFVPKLSDDIAYSGFFDWLGDKAVATHYKPHTGYALVRDINTPGIGLMHSYGRASYVAVTVADNILNFGDIFVGIWRAGARVVSGRVLVNAADDVIEEGALSTVRAYTLVPKGEIGVVTDLSKMPRGKSTYYTSATDARAAALEAPDHQLVELDMGWKSDYKIDMEAEGKGLKFDVDHRKHPEILSLPRTTRGPPTVYKDGWSKERVLRDPPGKRVSPEMYLDAEHLEAHREFFKNGGAWFTFPKYAEGSKEFSGFYGVRNPGDGLMPGLYMTSFDEIKEIVKSANGDIRVISEKLGTRWTDPDMRIQVFHGDPYSAGFRIPDGNVAGTDKELWIPGGKTSGGYHELSGPPISGDVVDSYTIQQFMEAFLQ